MHGPRERSLKEEGSWPERLRSVTAATLGKRRCSRPSKARLWGRQNLQHRLIGIFALFFWPFCWGTSEVLCGRAAVKASPQHSGVLLGGLVLHAQCYEPLFTAESRVRLASPVAFQQGQRQGRRWRGEVTSVTGAVSWRAGPVEEDCRAQHTSQRCCWCGNQGE